MLNSSVVLGPSVVMRMPGTGGSQASNFSLHRSVSRDEVSGGHCPYFLPIMGLFAKQLDPSDNRGAAGGPLHGGTDIVNCRHNRIPASGAGGRHTGDEQNMHISGGQSNSPVMEVGSSRAMVEDYVRYSIEKKGLHWESGQRDLTPDPIQRAMRAVGDEFADKFNEQFNDLANGLRFDPDSAEMEMRKVMDGIFEDSVLSWGRVVALVNFAGQMAVRCVQRQQPQLVHNVVDWASHYVDANSRLQTWMKENNGWAGFVEYFKDLDQQPKDPRSSLSLKAIVFGGAAAVGLLTLGGALYKS